MSERLYVDRFKPLERSPKIAGGAARPAAIELEAGQLESNAQAIWWSNAEAM
jgi:hypothetical protein